MYCHVVTTIKQPKHDTCFYNSLCALVSSLKASAVLACTQPYISYLKYQSFHCLPELSLSTQQLLSPQQLGLFSEVGFSVWIGVSSQFLPGCIS